MHRRNFIPRIIPIIFLITIVGCGGKPSTPATYPIETPIPGGGGGSQGQPYPQPTTPSPDDAVTFDPNLPPEEPGSPPWEPAPEDDLLLRSEVFIDEAQILVLESYPPQFMLSLSGTLPTPCHQLRAVVPEPDGQGNIMVEVYSLTDPGEICIQVLELFEVALPLQRPPQGEVYSVYVNDQEIGGIGF